MSANPKGPRFERKICQRLSLWVSDLTRDDLYWRTAMSGGRARRISEGTMKRKSFGSMVGDIAAIDSAGELLLSKFVVEVKHYHDLRWHRIPYGRNCIITQAWFDTMEMCEKLQREPLIILRQDHREEVVLTTLKGISLLNVGIKGQDVLTVTLTIPRLGACVFLFREMLQKVEFRRLRSFLKLKAINLEME